MIAYSDREREFTFAKKSTTSHTSSVTVRAAHVTR